MLVVYILIDLKVGLLWPYIDRKLLVSCSLSFHRSHPNSEQHHRDISLSLYNPEIFDCGQMDSQQDHFYSTDIEIRLRHKNSWLHLICPSTGTKSYIYL